MFLVKHILRIDMKRISPEASHQIMLFDWIRLQKHLAPYCFSIPNERKTSIQNGAHLKRMGLMPGASDIFVAIPTENYHGLFIEMKYGKNKPTANQLKFQENMRDRGYKTAICYGFDEAKKEIETYLKS